VGVKLAHFYLKNCPGGRRMKEIKKILVPIDFSDNSKKILKSARYVAEKFSAAISLIFVVQSFEDYSGFFVPHLPLDKLAGEMLAGAQKKMANFVEDNLEDITVQSLVVAGDVAEEILGYAEKEHMDLIIMGTHGYKGLERVLFGSIAEQVVKNSPCPILTINPYK
jgi:nucleotide-binding universal stress UspA family protein